jgi:hypothetical protein
MQGNNNGADNIGDDRQLLEQSYYNPRNPGSFGGFSRLKQSVPSISSKQVKSWLSGQRAYTLFRQRLKTKYPTKSYNVWAIDQQWSIDLADMQALAEFNDSYRYLLCIIDIFSKYAWVVPLKTKNSIDVARAMESIFMMTDRNPLNINSDQGTEFLNKDFKDLLRNYGVNQIVSYGQHKASVVERFIRTLKSRLYRYFEHFNSWRYIDHLQDFVYAYNHSFHTTIRTEPANVTVMNAPAIWKNLFSKLNKVQPQLFPKYKIGDIVRISNVKGPFEKGYTPSFKKEYYIIDQVIASRKPIYYKIKDFDDKKPVKGIFYEPELQKIRFTDNQPEQQEFEIERIVREKQIQGEPWAYVKFKGYPASYDQWMPKANVGEIN